MLRSAWQALQTDPLATLATHKNRAVQGAISYEVREKESYAIHHTVVDGIERIIYRPKNPRYQIPLLMQHGMWHGAWCWQPWQALFAEWGWESIAYSLPGHGNSPVQRPIRLCTLDYYLGFVRDEIQRQPHRPVYLGHSMGGALVQWYFKYVNDDLPAAVLVSSWPRRTALIDGLRRLCLASPAAVLAMALRITAAPLVSTPKRAAKVLLGDKALWTPEELHAKLDPESALVLVQHHPPFWQPPKQIETPLLWLAAEKDAVIGRRHAKRSAEFFGTDYVEIKDAGHNLMMEHNFQQTAETIHQWLLARNIK